MGKILEALADDNLCINPTTYKGPPEYQRAVNVMYHTAEELDNKLNDEEKKLLEKFRDAQADQSHICEIERFSRGYRLGVLMMFEVFAGFSDFFYGKEADE